MKKKILIFILMYSFNANAANIKASGTPQTGDGCGENCSWTLYEDGTFEIKGSGKMYNYTKVGGEKTYWTVSDDAPWSSYVGDIKSLSIGSDITSIGKAAFAGAYSLKSLDIPSNIEYIGSCAFLTSHLEDVKLPDTLSTIGSWAFNTERTLQTINIPTSLKTINNGLFYGSNIDTLIIPDTVQEIGVKAFGNTDMKSIVIGENVTSIGERAFEKMSVKIYCHNNEKRTCADLITSATYGSDKMVIYDINADGFYQTTDGKIFATLDLMAHGAACSDAKNCQDILTAVNNNRPFKVGNKFYATLNDFASGNYIRKRIYTILEASQIAGKKNSVMLKYR